MEAKRALWDIHLFTECPHCEEEVDLLDFADFWDGHTEIKIGEFGTKKTTDVEVDCPDCDGVFFVTMEY